MHARLCSSVLLWAVLLPVYGEEISLPAPHESISFFRTKGLPTMPSAAEISGSKRCSFEAGIVSDRLDRNLPADCSIEAKNHAIVAKWFSPDDSVLELGARYGSTSCGIASLQRNSGKLISVEPDRAVWESLSFNRHTHNCAGWTVRGVIADAPATTNNRSYGTRSIPVAQTAASRRRHRHSFTFEEIQIITGLTVSALMIDCEGCLEMLFRGSSKPLGQLLEHVNTIIMEGDMPIGAPDCEFACVNYTQWHEKFRDAGLQLVESIRDDQFLWIYTFVYRRENEKKISSSTDEMD